MINICDHTSVGMIVENDGKILLIERMKFPFGFAPPAGHVDGDESYEISAKRELKEEVGINTDNLEQIFEGRIENKCRREGGDWHYWKVYYVKTQSDKIKRSTDETKQVGWYTKEEIQKLANKTKRYLHGEISDEDWEASPGLETVWYKLAIENNNIHLLN